MKSIWSWFRADSTPETPLTGAPSHARTKTYSAAAGYVYQYVFRGYRPVQNGTEFVFETSRDRKEHFYITIRLCDSALTRCAECIGREILGKERYALAKMCLFRAFDEVDPGKLTGILVPDAAEMEAHLRSLGRID